MSVVGQETITEKIPKWESDLWFYISYGDGMHCPFRDHCQTRKRGSWCADDYAEQLNQFVDIEQFNGSGCNFVASGSCDVIFEWVRMLASKYLELGGITNPPVPMELISLIVKQQVEVRTLPLKACHGALWHFKDDWIIHLNSEETLTMNRFFYSTRLSIY